MSYDIPRSGLKAIKNVPFYFRRIGRGGVFKLMREILVNKWPSSMLKICSANPLYAVTRPSCRIHWLGASACSWTQGWSNSGSPTLSTTSLHQRALLPARLLHSGATVRQAGAKGVRREADTMG